MKQAKSPPLPSSISFKTWTKLFKYLLERCGDYPVPISIKKKCCFSKLVLLREMQKIVCLMEYFDLALLSYL